jgi:hypothetical protein
MNLIWLSLFANIISPPLTLKVSFGETVDHYQFRLPLDVASLYAASIDTSVLSQQEIVINYLDSDFSFNIHITMEGSLVKPLLGIEPFISQLSLNSSNSYLDIFNPTLENLTLASYAILINEMPFTFHSSLKLAPLSSQRIMFIPSAISNNAIDESFQIRLLSTSIISKITWLNVSNPIIKDQIEVYSHIPTQYGSLPISDWRFIRSNKITGPEPTYQPNSWVARPHGTIETPYQLMSPVVTPLQQATAWATYVMYGAGMFALGRVEEAFEALQSEYRFMDVMSQSLLFSQPETPITGINEQGKLDRSTFREAIGRYNYLAARVPGATGLSMPPADTFPWLSVLYASLLVMGFVGVIVVLKTAKRRT